MKRQWIITQRDHQTRIDDFVYRQGINKKTLKAIKMYGDILVDGVHQSVRYLLQEDQVITLVYPSEENLIPPCHIPLHIVYEDEYILIIDKPKNMPCIPTCSHPQQTLANAISFYYQQIGLRSTVHLVNRLDKETVGLMIVAKYREIHYLMSHNMQHIYRKYRAHVSGMVEAGMICLPIYQEGKAMKRIIDERGKPSCTYYRCRSYQNQISLVEFRLETGRTHQIRVHMAAIGHPLIGDPLYGGSAGEFDLESMMVAFVHPVTQQIKVIRKCKKV